jgi:tRNA(Ile)-lysidine synthase
MDVLTKQVDAVLRRQVRRSAHLLVGLSGGIDSVVLLHVLARDLQWPVDRLSAVHVNHQLSPHATHWAAFCGRLCRKLGVPLQTANVDVARGNSTEAAARAARYGVFAATGAKLVVLAHNRDDQAETVLLQLLRGAGPLGLAAMPELKTATRGAPAVLRPLLDVPRMDIAAYARAHRLKWMEDESNRDRAYLRNFLRHDILPALTVKVPGVGATLARAAKHQAEAADLLNALARQDFGRGKMTTLPVARLARLDSPRARNLLRYFLRVNGVATPDAVRLDELLRQAISARLDARVSIVLGRMEVRRFRGHLHIVKPLPRTTANLEWTWDGRGTLHTPELGGSLRLVRRRGAGIDARRLQDAVLTVRTRRGGESLRLSAGARRRTLRNLLQEAAIAPWVRDRLPCVFVNGKLACVTDLGVDSAFRARPGAIGMLPVWAPD